MARILKRYWHEAMLDCVAKHTNAPDSFITWAAFSLIGAIMKRKFYIYEGTYTIYPNQYVVLVGPPAVGKNTAVDFVWQLAEDSSPKIVNVIPDRVTAPRILERLAAGWTTAPQFVNVAGGAQVVQGATEHSCTIHSTELSLLLGASEQMIDYLCEWWSKGKFEYDTKNSGSAFVKDLAVSLMGATVPSFIKNLGQNRNMTITGGFTSRCIFVYADRPERYILRPPAINSNPTSRALLDTLKNDILHIASLPGGEFQYSAAAQIIFDDYMKQSQLSSKDDSEAIAHFKGRMSVHISKLAMILAISREDTLLITDVDMRKAIYYISQSLKTLEKVFRGSGDSNMAEATAHVQTYLENHGGVASRRELVKNLYRHMDTDTLDRILYVLEYIGYCTKVTQGNTQMYMVAGSTGVKVAQHPVSAGVRKP